MPPLDPKFERDGGSMCADFFAEVDQRLSELVAIEVCKFKRRKRKAQQQLTLEQAAWTKVKLGVCPKCDGQLLHGWMCKPCGYDARPFIFNRTF